ncbi:MAG: HAMP domain-containing protein, partial [Candidatus Rokubacteria bacterium]|nr:HAMP domain-containing protein [Candidatus Rokubacteria bacterium]
ARNLAAVSTGPLLLYDFTALEQNVAQVAQETDVAYAIILDAEGRVAARSGRPAEVGSIPQDPVSQRALKADAPLVQETAAPDTGLSLYEFVVPVTVEGQRWGTVRVALSKRRMEAEIAKTQRELALLAVVTLILGGVASALVARRIARPVRQLAEGVAAISRGELDQRIEPATSDEIGRLAVAFNHMASQLFQQRSALEAAHSELRQRFAELSDLKSYTDNILGSLTNGIITLDLEGRVVTLNRAAESITGCSLAEVTGRFSTEVFAHSPEVGELLMETVGSRVGVAFVSMILRRPDGTSVPIEISTAPLKGSEGKDAAVGPPGRPGHPRRRPGPRDQEPPDVPPHVHPASLQEVRRSTVPAEFRDRRPAGAGADQRHRRGPPRARPSDAPQPPARPRAGAAGSGAGTLHRPDRGPAGDRRPRVRAWAARDPG